MKEEEQSNTHTQPHRNGEGKPLLGGPEILGSPEKPVKQKTVTYQKLVSRLRAMVEHRIYIAIFLIATVWTLFADDCRILWMPKEADPYMFGLMFTTFVLFGSYFCDYL